MESGRSAPRQIDELDARTKPRGWPISGVTLFHHQIVVTLAKLAPAYPIWSGVRRLGDTFVPEPCPGDAGCLVGHGDQDDVCRPQHLEPVGPARPRAWFGAAPAQHGSRGLHEQALYGAIPALRYPPQPVLAATGVLPRHETEPGRELSARAKLRAISDRHRPRPARARSAPTEPTPGPAPADPATATATGPRNATATGAPRSPSPAQDAPPSAPRSCDSPATDDSYGNAGKAHGGPFGPAHAPNPQI